MADETRTWPGRLARFSAWLVGGLVGLVVVLVLALQLPPVQSWLKGEVVHRTNEALEGRIEVGNLSGSLLGSLHLGNMQVYDGRGRPVATIRAADLGYWLPSLLSGGLIVSDIRLERPRVLLRRYDDGTLNVATLAAASDAPPSDGEPFDFGLDFERISIESARILWDDRTISPPKEAPSLTLETVDAELERGRNEPRETSAVADWLEKARMPASGSPRFARISDFDLLLDVSMKGAVRIDATVDRLDAEVESDVLTGPHVIEIRDLRGRYGPEGLEARLASLDLGPGLGLRALRAEAATDADGKIGPFFGTFDSLRVEPELANGYLDEPPLLEPIALRATVGGTPEDLVWTVDAGRPGARPLRAGGRLQFRADAPLVADVSARLDGLAPGELVGLDLPALSASGGIDLHLEGMNWRKASGDLELGLWESRADQLQLHGLHVAARGRDGTLRLDDLALSSSHLRARGAGRVDAEGPFALDFVGRSGTRAFDTLPGLAPGSIELGADPLELDASLDGSIDWGAADPVAMVRRLDTSVGWEVGDVEVFGYSVHASEGDVSADVGPASTEGSDRRAEFDVSARVDRFRSPVAAVDSARLATTGRATVDPTSDSAAGALRKLRTDADLEARGLRHGASGSAVGRLEVAAKGSSDKPGGPLTAEATVDARSLAAPGASIAGIEGRARATLDSATSVSVEKNWQATLDLSTRNVEAAGIAASTADLSTELRAAAPLPVGETEATVRQIDLGGKRFERASADVRTAEGGSVTLDASVTTPEEWGAPVELSAEGRLSEDRRRVDLGRLELRRSDRAWALADSAALTLDDDAIRIEKFDLRNGDQRIAVDGRWSPTTTHDLRLDIERLNLAALRQFAGPPLVPEVAGTLDLEAALSGRHDAPRLELNLEGTRLSALGRGPFRTAVALRSSDGRVRGEKVELGFGGATRLKGTFDLPITWDLTGGYRLDTSSNSSLRLDVEPVRIEQLLSRFAPDLALPLRGVISGHAEAEGTLDNPRVDTGVDLTDASLRGEFGGFPVDIDHIEWSTQLEFGPTPGDAPRFDLNWDLRWQDEQRADFSLTTDAPIGRWSGDVLAGRSPPSNWVARAVEAPIDLKLDIAQTDLGTLPIEPLRRTDASGVIDAKFEVSDSLSDPDARLTVDVDDFGWNQYRDIVFDLDTRLRDGRLAIRRLRLEWDAEEVLVGGGEIPMPINDVVQGRPLADAPIDFSLDLKPFSIVKLGAVDYSFTRFQGTFSGYLHIGGTLASPELDTRVAIRDARFSDRHRGTIGVWARAGDGRAEGGMLLCSNDENVLTSDFDVPLNLDVPALVDGASLLPAGPVRASVRGTDVPIGQIVPQPLVQDVVEEAEGRLDVDLKVEGDWQHLESSGRVEVREGAVTLVEYGRRLRAISLDTRLRPDAIDVRNLSAEAENGRVQTSGTIQLDRLTPTKLDFRAETEDFNLEGFAGDYTALVTSTSEITGSLDTEPRELELRVTSLSVDLPETQGNALYPTSLAKDIVIASRYADEGAAATRAIDEYLLDIGASAASELRVRVILEDDSRINHPSGELQLRADLTADVGNDSTVLAGGVDSLSGSFEFLGQEFDVAKRNGMVRFPGARPPDPQLDVLATHEIDRAIASRMERPSRGDPEIRIRVTGSASSPQLDMSSDPTMTESEIVYLLMTRRPPASAEPGEEKGVAKEAMSAATGVLSGVLGSKLASAVPLVDLLEVEAGEQGLQDAQLRVGTYITPEVFLVHEQKLGRSSDEGLWETRIEYQFVSRWMLEAKYGHGQTGSLNVFWDIY